MSFFGKGEFPEREKKEVQLFDIREFVKERKKKKMEEMMSSSDLDPSGGMSNPFGGMGGNPFAGMGGNPFGGMGGNPFAGMGRNPFAGKPSDGGINSLLGAGGGSNTSPDNGSFNVDDLVKKIDAKIAELEEEERKEKENQDGTKEEVKVDEAVNEDSSRYEDGTNSDSFFDDFFSDE